MAKSGQSEQPKGSDDNNHADQGDQKPELKVDKTPTSPALLTRMAQQRYYRRAKAPGPGRTGAAIWVVQRATALALVPLVLWFATAMIALSAHPRADAAAWLGNPWNAAPIALLLVVAMRHATIGLRIIFEDYVHTVGLRLACVLAVNAVAVLLTLAAIVSLVLLLAAGTGVV